MKFCPECGAKVEGLKFCPECGYKLDGSQEPVPATPKPAVSDQDISGEDIILKFSTFMFGLENMKKQVTKNIDLTLPQYDYTLTTQRLFVVKKGYIAAKRDEIELYKIKDVTVKQTLSDKVLGVGDITLYSVDGSTPILLIKRVKNPIDIKEAIRSAMRAAKDKMHVTYRENF